ncbi:MAG: hypothetical protein IT529_06425 [Burkholderiales bacterium]|nr:hypothetical protein [Burkholderiales bacterium]
MHHKALLERRTKSGFVVAPAGASTWVVAFSRHLIPGACFKTRNAALDYASILAAATGVGRSNVRVLDA